ncbi:MAG: Stk1 family PASTA domain-containing Ser/Thr kinase [Nakamurella sp.]
MTAVVPPLGERYQIGDTLGFGGMSEVHRGRDLRLGRDVAIKVLRADLARDPSFQARFRREAQNAASLNHPAIVAVYDTGETAGENGPVPYIVMEYVDGQTLREILRKEGALPARRAMEIMADVCAALDFSHRHGIVHRDVKPANIMLTKAGAVKVMDFGIARAMNDSGATQTATAAVIGTAQYLSPEQARGETVDARSDVYATGCVLYELLTGTPPFVGDSPVAIAYQHVREDAKAPSEANPQVPAELDAIVLKALNKNPLNRYQTAAEMRSDMVRALSGQAVHATPVMSDDERTELMRATPARTPAASMLAPPSRVAPMPLPDEDTEEQRRRRVWGFVGVGALCLAVLAAAIWVTISLTSRPEQTKEVPVPALTGMTQSEATIAARNAGFEIDPQTVPVEVAADQVGKVQEQNPSPRTVVPTTDKIRLTMGVAQSLVKVPNIRGLDQGNADATLKQNNLIGVFVPTESAATDKGLAFEQDVAAGSDVQPGTTVTVKIGTGVPMSTVPAKESIVGQQFDPTKSQLEAAGFVVYQQTQASSAPVGQILDMTGANPGQAVQKGTIITLITSDNSLFRVPNVTQQSEKTANATLIAAGWADGNAVQVNFIDTNNPGQWGVIIKQDPGADTDYLRNGVIKVTVGQPGRVTMPDLRGKTQQEAQAAVQAAGFAGRFVVNQVTVADPAQVGRVQGQTPQASSVVAANSRVTVQIGAAAPPPTPTPPPTPPATPETPPSEAPPTG